MLPEAYDQTFHSLPVCFQIGCIVKVIFHFQNYSPLNHIIAPACNPNPWETEVEDGEFKVKWACTIRSLFERRLIDDSLSSLRPILRNASDYLALQKESKTPIQKRQTQKSTPRLKTTIVEHYFNYIKMCYIYLCCRLFCVNVCCICLTRQICIQWSAWIND